MNTHHRQHSQFWTFRLPATLSAQVAEDASRSGQTISQYIRVALQEKTASQGVVR